MQKCIRSIENPSNVAAIQKFFGVTYNKRLHINSSEKECPNEEICMVSGTSITKSQACVGNKINEDNDVATKISSNLVENGIFSSSEVEGKDYTIKYKFWYYYFISITYLGDVIGYAFVIPFVFWNIDGVIARKLVLVWTVVMYVGQAVKEIVCRGRPKCPPVIRLQKRWSEEYGMPSTHAIASVALPASLLYYGIKHYKLSLEFGLLISSVWCILISFSRLYLGMHSILDILAGFLLSILLLIPLLPMMDFIGDSLVEYNWSPLILLMLSIFFIASYPKSKGHTTAHTRTDTTIILATCVGIEIGCWLDYKLKILQKVAPQLSHFAIDWHITGLIAFRTILGLFCIFISFIISELVTKFTYCILNKSKVSRDNKRNDNKKIIFVDLCLKYLTFCITSIHVVLTIPLVFKILNIHRSPYISN